MEEWKVIPFESNYEVSNYGNIRNFETKIIKNQRYSKSGYKRITLYPSGITYAVHRLVGLTWMKDTHLDHLQIDHLNAVRDDNRLENLEWVTPEENNRRIKNRVATHGSNNGMSKLTEEDVIQIKYYLSNLDNSTCSKLFDVKPEAIRRIRKREQWKYLFLKDLEEQWENGSIQYAVNKNSNLSPDTKSKIQGMILDGKTNSEIAKIVNVSRNSVSRIRKNLIG